MKKSTIRIAGILCVALFVVLSLAVGQRTKEIHKTLPLNKDGELVLDTYKGSIRIDPWDRGEVDIVAKIEADGTDRDADDAVEDTEIEIRGSDQRVSIKTDYSEVRERHSGLFGFFNVGSQRLPFVHYTIKIPRSAEARVKDYKSESKITGMEGPLRLNTYKGEAKIFGHQGRLDLETYKGEVEISFDKLRDDCSLETYKGEIRLQLPRGQGFTLDADMGRRADLDSDFGLGDLRSRRRSGDERYRGDVNGGGPRVSLKSYKGEIRLREGERKGS